MAALPSLAVTAGADERNVVILEDRGGLFEPAQPFDLDGRTLRFDPRSEGYSTAIVAGTNPIERSGRVLGFAGGEASVRVTLAAPVPFFGRQYTDLFVHRAGAISFGGPIPGDGPVASEGGELVSSLLSPVPWIAALWSELRPGLAPNGEILAQEDGDGFAVTWNRVAVSRPAGALDTFRIRVRRSGSIEIEYGGIGGRWGVVGLSPGPEAEKTRLAEIRTGLVVGPRETVVSRYHDLPALNPMAVTRQLFEETRDVFPFVTVFTTEPVDAESAVSSITVRNEIRGIGLPVFDDGEIWGSRRLEHLVLMGGIDAWDDDPFARPRLPAYSYAPSTLSVLAHETGHRWLAHVDGALGESLHGDERHWNFFLDSGGSLLGGSDLIDDGDGGFETGRVLGGFGPLDQYLMGLREPSQVDPFFLVEDAHAFTPATDPAGRGWTSRSRPRRGVSFRGTRRDLSIADVIASQGAREPSASVTGAVHRMAFVLVVPAGGQATARQLERVDRIRRAFGPFFQEATENRARIQTWLPKAGPELVPGADDVFATGEPRILEASVRAADPQATRRSVDLEFADFDGDVVAVEASTDATASLPMASRDVIGHAFGHRRGRLTLHMSRFPEEAQELRLVLVDRRGQRSPVVAVKLRAA